MDALPATTRITSEFARNLFSSPSPALPDSILIPTTDVWLVPDHARPALQPQSASPVPPPATSPTQSASVPPSAEMASSSALRPAIPATPTLQDAPAAKSRLTTPAQDNPQSAPPPLSLPLLLPHPHQHPLLHPHLLLLPQLPICTSQAVQV